MWICVYFVFVAFIYFCLFVCLLIQLNIKLIWSNAIFFHHNNKVVLLLFVWDTLYFCLHIPWNLIIWLPFRFVWIFFIPVVGLCLMIFVWFLIFLFDSWLHALWMLVKNTRLFIYFFRLFNCLPMGKNQIYSVSNKLFCVSVFVWKGKIQLNRKILDAFIRCDETVVDWQWRIRDFSIDFVQIFHFLSLPLFFSRKQHTKVIILLFYLSIDLYFVYIQICIW